jgi:hypothetical protein
MALELNPENRVRQPDLPREPIGYIAHQFIALN